MAQQEDGCFPRLNGALIQSGKFDSAIVSVVGKFIPSKATDGTFSFRCADNVEIVINPESMTETPQLDFHDGPVVEVVGQASNGTLVVSEHCFKQCLAVLVVRRCGDVGFSKRDLSI